MQGVRDDAVAEYNGVHKRGERYYNSWVRNKITASVEAAHDQVTGVPALEERKKSKITVSKIHRGQTPAIRWKGDPKKERDKMTKTHDDDFPDVGFPTICASKTLTNPSIAFSPGRATSPA